ncbi:TonB-dependent receptor [Idiomarina abyssalis]|jgi:iron complex outermembrane receptor protein|uniref:TonB-dependent receptor n=1 Tax=Idiomarina abyssalis TaxID=86102 RepID=UPI001C988AC3|nr:TonB-dependent receptor [Idiomarina abyssalis]QZN90508.1 TonB-dependent receptor [Idiomarina abyssalis]
MKQPKFQKSLIAAAVTTLLSSPMVLAQQNENAEAEDGKLERIEVTARRTNESLQEVPVAVSAFGEGELERDGIEDITELQYKMPNTTFQVSRGTNSTLTAYIRGVGQQDPLWGFEPGVGIYIDDVYVARPQGAVLEVLDVQRVEVLRGPQGTLYGKNTIGGAMKYVTRELTGYDEFEVKGTVGTYNQRDLKVSGQTALADNFYVGGAFATLNRDGFGEFVNTGDENYNKELMTGRFNAKWLVNKDINVKFAADWTKDDSNARGGHREQESLLSDEPRLTDVYDAYTAMPTWNEVENEGYSMTVDWAINNDWMFKSITAYREGSTNTNIDFDSTVNPVLLVPAVYEDEQTTQEFQFMYRDDRLDFVGGLYFYEGEACGEFGTVLGLLGLSIDTGGCVDTSSEALFGQATYQLDDQWSVTLGGRYTRDDKSADVFRYTYAGIKFLDRGDYSADPIVINSDFTTQADWSKFSPHASVSYQVDPAVMLYASYSNGFKSGGVDMRADVSLNPDASNPYDPETVDTVEFGVKSEMLDGRMRLNAAAFFSDYQDMQVTVQRAIEGGGVASQVLNAADSTVQGFEIESTFAATPTLNFNGSLGYIDAEFDSVAFFNPETQQVEDVSDLWSFQNTPKVTANLGFTKEFALESGSLVWSTNVSYRDDTQIFEVPSPLDEEAYSLTNTSVVWYSNSSQWTVGLHAKNVFDEEYRVSGYNFGSTFGENIVTGYYGDPRTVSLSVGYRF